MRGGEGVKRGALGRDGLVALCMLPCLTGKKYFILFYFDLKKYIFLTFERVRKDRFLGAQINSLKIDSFLWTFIERISILSQCTKREEFVIFFRFEPVRKYRFFGAQIRSLSIDSC